MTQRVPRNEQRSEQTMKRTSILSGLKSPTKLKSAVNLMRSSSPCPLGHSEVDFDGLAEPARDALKMRYETKKMVNLESHFGFELTDSFH